MPRNIMAPIWRMKIGQKSSRRKRPMIDYKCIHTLIPYKLINRLDACSILFVTHDFGMFVIKTCIKYQ